MEGRSCSLRRAGIAGLLLNWGGGDRRRGDTGHRGLSLSSALKTGFCGVGAWICCCCCCSWEGASVGVLVEDNERDGAAEDKLGRVVREGLLSVWLFFRDRLPGKRFAEAVLRGRRVGEESLEAKGEGPTELLAEDCFEF